MKNFRDDAQSKTLLRFTTAGSVDDGKSTLIGRLLYDSKQIYEDQLEVLERSADLTGGGAFNFANLTDGLRAEREQGITIDVAYRYFSTPRRKFIVADTPGHIQYTRNMVTGASTADLAIVLIDARQGVLQQTQRHAYIASLLGIPFVAVCINKMDLVDYSQDVFQRIVDDCHKVFAKLSIKNVAFFPICALSGDNVVEKSNAMPWYDGPPLLTYLEEVEIVDVSASEPARFPVQYVIRPYADDFHDFRGLAGQVASGELKVGDCVVVLPSGLRSRIERIYTYDGDRESAYAPMSVTILLKDDIDVSRGDMVVQDNALPLMGQDAKATICWFNERPLQLNSAYALKQSTKWTRCMVKSVSHIVDMQTCTSQEPSRVVAMNDIAQIEFKTMQPLVFDPYKNNRETGNFILVDEATNETVAAGMLEA